jgi:hypothetical protein
LWDWKAKAPIRSAVIGQKRRPRLVLSQRS